MSDNDAAVKISLLFSTLCSVGGGLVAYGQGNDVFTVIGGVIFGWVVLLIIFINLFSK